jgi:hypothetical protein
MSEETAYRRALRLAYVEGQKAGQNAAGWTIQEIPGGGRNTQNHKYGAADARLQLKAIEDGDADWLPYPDFSGEWAGGPDWDEEADSILGAADYPCSCQEEECADSGCDCYRHHSADSWADLLNEYEDGYHRAAETAIVRHLRHYIEDSTR